MSLVGQLPITIPDSVTLTITEDTVSVKGPKGELSMQLHQLIEVSQNEGVVTVKRLAETKEGKSLHGTYQRLVSNMVTGVTDGFEKTLELVGVGYRVAKQGNKLVLSLGYSHPIEFPSPEKIEFEVEGNNKITIKGISKQIVGQTAAKIRALRKPEPYKGKGIKYSDEVVRRKAGKASKTGA